MLAAVVHAQDGRDDSIQLRRDLQAFGPVPVGDVVVGPAAGNFFQAGPEDPAQLFDRSGEAQSAEAGSALMMSAPKRVVVSVASRRS